MAHVLLVGADEEHSPGIRSLLRRDGHRVTWHRGVREWRSAERETQAELVIAVMDGSADLLGEPGRAPHRFPAPLLLIQEENDFQSDLHHEERLVDQISLPFLGGELLGRVDALIRVLRVVHRTSSHVAQELITDSRTRSLGGRLSSWLRSRMPRDEKPLGPYLEVAARVAAWADRRDSFAPGHAERVASSCARVAGVLGMEEQETSALLRAALLHDIGKVALPVEVLHQKQPLEEAQRRLIRTHPARGAALLRALDPDESLARAVLYHHESPNGQGYYGKEQEGVPKASRVLAVTEAFDAMTHSRLREALSSEQAIALLQAQKGKAYDAESVEALSEAIRPRTPPPFGRVLSC